MATALETFDGRDNRRELMVMLQRLGTDARRAAFLRSLIPASLNGFAGAPMQVTGRCDPVAAYYMLVGVCNELGVPIDEAARRLERLMKNPPTHEGSHCGSISSRR